MNFSKFQRQTVNFFSKLFYQTYSLFLHTMFDMFIVKCCPAFLKRKRLDESLWLNVWLKIVQNLRLIKLNYYLYAKLLVFDFAVYN